MEEEGEEERNQIEDERPRIVAVDEEEEEVYIVNEEDESLKQGPSLGLGPQLRRRK